MNAKFIRQHDKVYMNRMNYSDCKWGEGFEAGVYARVDHVVEWINNVTNNCSRETCHTPKKEPCDQCLSTNKCMEGFGDKAGTFLKCKRPPMRNRVVKRSAESDEGEALKAGEYDDNDYALGSDYYSPGGEALGSAYDSPGGEALGSGSLGGTTGEDNVKEDRDFEGRLKLIHLNHTWI